jgi:hypothetical protein
MMNSSIRLIDSHNIDENKWVRMLSKTTPLHSQYCEYWYINSVCKKWKAYVKGDYESGFPFAINTKTGFEVIYQPFFTRQFPFLGSHDGQFISEVFSMIKKDFRWIRINLPFSFNELTLDTTLLNFQSLNLSFDYSAIYNNYSSNAKRILKKTEGLKLVKSNHVDDFIFLFEKEVGSKIGLVDENYRSLNSLITNGISNDKIQLFSINKNEIVLGFVCLYFHKNIINYLKGTLTTEGKKVGGMYFAFDQIIQQYAAKDCIFDFGGSNVKGIASFYEKFGAKNLTYYSHEYNQLPKLINKLKKIKDKLL